MNGNLKCLGYCEPRLFGPLLRAKDRAAMRGACLTNASRADPLLRIFVLLQWFAEVFARGGASKLKAVSLADIFYYLRFWLLVGKRWSRISRCDGISSQL